MAVANFWPNSAFLNAVGITPKEYARVRRLQALLRTLNAEREAIADAAVRHGYNDQATFAISPPPQRCVAIRMVMMRCGWRRCLCVAGRLDNPSRNVLCSALALTQPEHFGQCRAQPLMWS